jgi:hypothetical protein
MIHIDFQAGAHGNYLEFVCNKFLATIPTISALPFNHLGASHDKKYLKERIFVADHYTGKKINLVYKKLISIRMTPDDLLQMSMVSMLRSGDFNLDNDLLEKNTYFKLDNPYYRSTLEMIILKYSDNSLVESYNNVKDDLWPDVTTFEDFNELPPSILSECKELHRLEVFELSEKHPDCPRYILREFFKYGFKNPEQSGYLMKQNKMVYNENIEVFNFPFSSFYHTESFINEIRSIGQWANMPIVDEFQLKNLHEHFLDLQIYKDEKKRCDAIFDKITSRRSDFVLPRMNMMTEAYLNARMEKYYCKDAPFIQEEWFSTIEDILSYFE